MKHFSIALLTVAVLCQLSSIAVAQSVNSVHPIRAVFPPRRIGVIAPLTGTTSTFGVSVKNSVELANEMYGGGTDIQFLFEDDEFLPQKTISAAKKLIQQDKVDGLIVFGTPTSLAVAPVAEQEKKPLVALSILESLVEGKHYVMKHWVTARAENDLIGKEIRARGYKTVAIVAAQNDATLFLKKLFLEGQHPDVVVNEEFPRGETDFRSIVSRIRASKPDAVYNLLWAPQPGVFNRQLRDLGYAGQVFGTHNIEDANEVKASQGALEDTWFVTADDRAAKEYLKRYEEKYHALPTAGGVNAFDVAKIFIEISETPNLNESLHNLKNFSGALGRYSATSKNDFEIPAIRKIVRNGGFQVLEPE